MSTQTSIVVAQTNKLAKLFDIPQSDELVAVLKQTAFKGQVSDAQMSALLIVANQYKLNPWTKEIYAFPDKNNGIVPVVGVDGWSRIINEHPQFDGLDFEQTDDECTCIIYRKDRSHPIRVTEYLSECKRNTQPWQSHPKRMLRHKALIQASRLAFGYTGIYDQDEAEVIAEKEINPAPAKSFNTPKSTKTKEQPATTTTTATGTVIDNDSGEILNAAPEQKQAPAQTAAGMASAGMLTFIRKKAAEKDIPEEVICAEHEIESFDQITEEMGNTIVAWIRAQG